MHQPRMLRTGPRALLRPMLSAQPSQFRSRMNSHAAVGGTTPLSLSEVEGHPDNLEDLLRVLPLDVGAAVASHPARPNLIEVVLDLGRRPEARFVRGPAEYLRATEVTRAELARAEAEVGAFGSDNRAGVPGTLHRISALRARSGAVVGLTCRIGRAVRGHADLARDILAGSDSMLFLGRPGVGKTTAIREMARVLADELGRRVVIVDTSNEIGGDGDVPHAAIGSARRMQVPDASRQHEVMIEAVENHMPQVVIVDEVGTAREAAACRTIAERGVQLIATAHGNFLENLLKNPTLSDLVGGVQSVTLGDEEAARRKSQKSVLERARPPTFPVTIEMRDRCMWVAHYTQDSVDALLASRVPRVQLRCRDPATSAVSVVETAYDCVEAALAAEVAARSRSGSLDGGSASPATSLDGGDLEAAAAAGGASLAAAMAALGAVSGGTAALGGGDVAAWGERLAALSEGEAVQELEVLRYLGDQAGVLRTARAGLGFSGGAAATAGSAAGSAAVAAAAVRAKKRSKATVNARR